MLGSHRLNIIDDLQEYRVSVRNNQIHRYHHCSWYGICLHRITQIIVIHFLCVHLCTMELIVVLLKMEVTNFIAFSQR